MKPISGPSPPISACFLRTGQHRRRVCRPWSFFAGIALLSMGCRGDGLDRRYPVSGVVTYKGQAVESGTISFHPKDAAGRVAAGTIVAGAYHLTTLTPSDGAFPGIYDVTVVAKRVDRLARPPFVGGQVSQEEIARATKAARNDVPEKYQRAPSSGLTREVRPRRNRFDFDLVD